MASKFCTSCGAPIVEGKRFCERCGKPIAQKQSPSSEGDPPSLRGQQPCTQCGFLIPAGKRFCMKCGKAVGEAAPAVVVTTEVPAQVAVPSLTGSVDVEVPKRNESVPQDEIPIFTPPQAPASVTPPIRLTEPAYASSEPSLPATPAVMPKAQAASASAVVVEAHRKWNASGWVVAVVLLVIVAGGVVGAWLYQKRTSKAKVASAPSSITAVSPPVAVPAISSESTTKPAPGAPAQNVPSNSVAASTQVPDASTQASAQKQSSLPQTAAPKTQPHVSGTSPQEEIVKGPTPPSLAVPAAPTAGDLHYSGPPIHPGGTVVFQNLPAGRLRFVFDHQAWQPLILRQPDGSQTLTLRSLRQIDQTECNVHWEQLAH